MLKIIVHHLIQNHHFFPIFNEVFLELFRRDDSFNTERVDCRRSEVKKPSSPQNLG